ncbi:Hypothetical Protein FCC1311_027502 [Hondaea fermentalgiana]|uniref:Uncharacterized protein n=1 Tax=Hondaea fermentalgiana TaxID=2315210 RepID=A0A2R5G880_9STRA|nr:Hypothetical Protein FCC1311_027502 [Hondaea fermentalgiana]|eukprot:GBG26529.1 Hypothetical Protein FCC1311_027502 [Hondaea fermentalgiana]
MALCEGSRGRELDEVVLKGETAEEKEDAEPETASYADPPELVCEGKIMKALKDDGLAYASSMDLSVWNVGTQAVKKRKRMRTVNVVANAAGVEDILQKYQTRPRTILYVSVFYEAVPGYSTMNKEVGHFSIDISSFINESYALAMGGDKRSSTRVPKKNSHFVQIESDVDFDFDGFAQLVRHFIHVELGLELGIKMKFIIDGTRVRIHKSRFQSVTSHATPYVPLLASIMRSRKDECYRALYAVEHSALQVFFHVYSRISAEIESISTKLSLARSP